MDTNDEKIVNDLKKTSGKDLIDMRDEYFKSFMEKQSKKTLLLVRDSLITDREFYKKILSEEHAKKNPNSYRYSDARIKIEKINEKGKLLKAIIEIK
jgi:hypothetical protein